MSEMLDLARIAPSLDRLVALARSPGGDGEQLLQQARRLLGKAREAEVAEPGPGESGAGSALGATGWHAVVSRDLPSTEDVTCWRNDGDVEASLHGTWSSGRLRLMQLTVDDAAWGIRMTAAGASYFSTGAAIDGPADRRLLERIHRGIRDERQRAARQLAARQRVCPRCSWLNEPGAERCAFCGTVDIPWQSTARHPKPEERAEPVGATHELAAPEGYEPGAIPDLVGELTVGTLRSSVGFDALRGVGESAAAGPRGDIVLDGFDPDRKASVVGAVIDACEQAGARRPNLAQAAALVENLPAVVCRDVDASRAADIQRHLAAAGASTRFGRSDD